MALRRAGRRCAALARAAACPTAPPAAARARRWPRRSASSRSRRAGSSPSWAGSPGSSAGVMRTADAVTPMPGLGRAVLASRCSTCSWRVVVVLPAVAADRARTPRRRGCAAEAAMTAVETSLGGVIAGRARSLYALLGGADFGGGVWDLLASRPAHAASSARSIAQAIGPIWEANHVWLILVVVCCSPASRGVRRAGDRAARPAHAAAGRHRAARRGVHVPHLRLPGRPARRALGLVFSIASVVTPVMLGHVRGRDGLGAASG